MANDVSMKELVKAMLDDNQYSPGSLTLERLFSYVPVFIYGTGQHNFSAEDDMGGFPRVGVGRTVKPFQMFIVNHEPVIFDPTNAVHMVAPVLGEIYMVPPSVIFYLDGLMCNGIQFHRRYEWIEYHELGQQYAKNSSLYHSEAFVYVGHRAEWDKYKQYNDRARLFRSEVWPDHYRFTMADDLPNRRMPSPPANAVPL